MRTTSVLLLKRKYSRNPLRPHEIEKIPFRELSPLQLKNSVSGATSKAADVSCLEEMAVMFACMKKNDFKEVKCAQEITTFNKCYSEFTSKKKALKAREESGEMITTTNARSLTTKQLNVLLKKYPQTNEKL